MGKGRLDGQAFVRLWNLRTEQAFETAPGSNGEFTFGQALILPGTYAIFLVNGQKSLCLVTFLNRSKSDRAEYSN